MKQINLSRSQFLKQPEWQNQFSPTGQPPPPSRPSNPPTVAFPWTLCTAAVCPGCTLFIQSSCPPWYTLQVTHLCKGWKQKLLTMTCGVEAVSKSALSSLYSPFLDVYRRQKGWLIPSVWTHKAEESSHFSVAREKCTTFYYKVVINVWRDKGCTLALKKCGVIPSMQNSNEQIYSRS